MFWKTPRKELVESRSVNLLKENNRKKDEQLLSNGDSQFTVETCDVLHADNKEGGRWNCWSDEACLVVRKKGG